MTLKSCIITYPKSRNCIWIAFFFYHHHMKYMYMLFCENKTFCKTDGETL